AFVADDAPREHPYLRVRAAVLRGVELALYAKDRDLGAAALHRDAAFRRHVAQRSDSYEVLRPRGRTGPPDDTGALIDDRQVHLLGLAEQGALVRIFDDALPLAP